MTVAREILEANPNSICVPAEMPQETIGFMGQTVISAVALSSHNQRVGKEFNGTSTDVFFNTTQPILEIDGSPKRYTSGVARILAELIKVDDGQCLRTDMREKIAEGYRLQLNSANSLVSEALTGLKYYRRDPRGPLAYMHGNLVVLRRDLLFLPVGTKTPEPTKIIPVKHTPRPKPIKVQEDTVKTRENWRTGQLYAAWWPRYEPRQLADLLNTEGQYSGHELEGQQEFTYHDEDPDGQRVLDIYRGVVTKSQFLVDEPEFEPQQSIPIEHPQFDFGNAPQPEDSTNSPEVNVDEKTTNHDLIKIFRTADEFIQVAMTAAFDYFFKGGELPIVTDVATYNAFQKALQEIGGYESTEISGPVVKLYFGKDEIRLKNEVRQRIKALGESIHVDRPREVNMRTLTPSEDLSNASKEWMRDGACNGLDPNIFFPDRYANDDSPDVLVAKAICQYCAVQADCLEYALLTRQKSGMWGGATEAELRRQRRRRARGLRD